MYSTPAKCRLFLFPGTALASFNRSHLLEPSSRMPPTGRINWRIQLGLVFAALFVALIVIALLSHHSSDPGFASGANPGVVANLAGRFGAWTADVGLRLFGWSVWWVPITSVVGLARVFNRERSGVAASNRERAEHWSAAAVLVIASCAIESNCLPQWQSTLPSYAGGLLGHLVGPISAQWIGSVGSSLCWIALWAVATPVALNFSWARLSEHLGRHIEQAFHRVRIAVTVLNKRRLAHKAERREQQVQKTSALDEGVRIDPRPAFIESPVLGRELPTADDFDAEVLEAVEPESVIPPPPSPAPAPVPTPAPKPRVQYVRPTPVTASVIAPHVADQPSSAPSELSSVPSAQMPLPPMANPEPVLPPPVKIVVAPQQVPMAKPTDLLSSKPSALTAATFQGELPPLTLLDQLVATQATADPEMLAATSRLIETKLNDFGVQVRVVEAVAGPVITRYEIEPATGVKGSQVVNLAKDLARALSLVSIRVVETIPGRTTMALELPNPTREVIRLSEILGSQAYHDATSMLTMALGKDIVGAPVVADLAKMPHCLVAGTTGSGKSVGINAMILSLLYKADPRDVRLLLIDPKMLEMSVYEGIPHLLAPVVTDMKLAANALNWCVGEMERRYKIMSKLGVRNLAGYNAKIDEANALGTPIGNPFSLTPDDPESLERLPFVAVVIDELADLMMVIGKKVEELIARLAQKARAAGIHLVLATQRPSVDVITGLIKANIPTRLSFQVSSKIDSRTILDQMGAEALLGMGDMLYMSSGSGLPVRVHGAFVSDNEVHRVVEYLKAQGEPNYVEGLLEGGISEAAASAGSLAAGQDGEAEPMYDQAVAVVLENRRASISLVQRHLRIGYNRAARLLEQMEISGVVSAMSSNGNRDIIAARKEID